MSDQITLDFFTRKDDPEKYKIYRSMKYDVFVVERGWQNLVEPSEPGIAKVDPFDDSGIFCLARTSRGRAVGIVRSIGLDNGFPHRELFKRHLDDYCFNNSLKRLCSLNSLAVLPPFRQKEFVVKESDWKGRVSKLLILSIAHRFQQRGYVGLIATATGFGPAEIFHELGFQVIDLPKVTPLHTSELTNIGIAFESRQYTQALKNCLIGSIDFDGVCDCCRCLATYFEGQEQNLIGSRSLKSLFG